MNLRDDLRAERAATLDLDRALGAIEARLQSRNAAHLVSRARSMARATGELISQALAQPLDAAPVIADRIELDERSARAALDELPLTVLAVSQGAARMRFRQLNDAAGNAATEAMMDRLGWRRNERGYWHRPGYGAAQAQAGSR